MNHKKCEHYYWKILFSFLVSMILDIFPISSKLSDYNPNWNNIFLIYWSSTFPRRINLNISFFFGLIVDVLLRTCLGIHALAFSFLTYLIILKIRHVSFKNLWCHLLLVPIFSLITQFLILSMETITQKSHFFPEKLLNVLSDSVVWPFYFFFMKKIFKV